jgi:hypothetical protein
MNACIIYIIFVTARYMTKCFSAHVFWGLTVIEHHNQGDERHRHEAGSRRVCARYSHAARAAPGYLSAARAAISGSVLRTIAVQNGSTNRIAGILTLKALT